MNFPDLLVHIERKQMLVMHLLFFWKLHGGSIPHTQSKRKSRSGMGLFVLFWTCISHAGLLNWLIRFRHGKRYIEISCLFSFHVLPVPMFSALINYHLTSFLYLFPNLLSDELKRHEEYFVNLAVCLLSAYKVLGYRDWWISLCPAFIKSFLHFLMSVKSLSLTRMNWGQLSTVLGNLWKT